MDAEKLSFDLVTLNPPLVFGPVISYPTDSAPLQLNTSNQRIGALVDGKLRDGPLPPTGVYLWVDVRDLALAHLRALTAVEAGGQRFLVAAGYFSNKAIVDAIRDTHPALSSKLPEQPVDDTPPNLYTYDDRKTASILGLTSYRSFSATIRDTVDSLVGRIQG
jgi:nucleoside-diphosphate-sugar epimerase